jgi:phosphatidylinositol glycan class V
MSGFLAFVYALRRFNKNQTVAGSAMMVLAGLSPCAATIVRSNGILAGIPFLFEAITAALGILSQGLSTTRLAQLASLGAGGLLVGVGLVYPQFLAYREYCYGRSPDDRRPWCNLTLPSIFTWVQSHYWYVCPKAPPPLLDMLIERLRNVGPFRYWTVSNLPLFLLAGPSLWLLTYSAIDVLRYPARLAPGMSPARAGAGGISSIQKRIIISLAVPQLVLAILALTSYHVQIITRLSSGYPLWYIWLASKLQDEPKRASLAIRWMVLYAMLQAGLYACFLPPA